ALPSLGRITSPTRFTPSLAGIVTSDIVVSARAPAASGPATARAASTAAGGAEARDMGAATRPRRGTGAGAVGSQGFFGHDRRVHPIRQREVEDAAAARRLVDPDLAAVALDDLLADRQADAGARELVARVQAAEHLEDPLGVVGVDAQAVVLHRDP